MLSVRLPETEVPALLSGSLAIAVVNSPKLCVVSGPHEELMRSGRPWSSGGGLQTPPYLARVPLPHDGAPMARPFTERVSRVKLAPAQIPILSTLTGQWIKPEESATQVTGAGSFATPSGSRTPPRRSSRTASTFSWRWVRARH